MRINGHCKLSEKTIYTEDLWLTNPSRQRIELNQPESQVGPGDQRTIKLIEYREQISGNRGREHLAQQVGFPRSYRWFFDIGVHKSRIRTVGEEVLDGQKIDNPFDRHRCARS